MGIINFWLVNFLQALNEMVNPCWMSWQNKLISNCSWSCVVSALHHIATKLIQSQVLNLFIKLDFDMLKSKPLGQLLFGSLITHSHTVFSFLPYTVLFFEITTEKGEDFYRNCQLESKVYYFNFSNRLIYFTGKDGLQLPWNAYLWRKWYMYVLTSLFIHHWLNIQVLFI